MLMQTIHGVFISGTGTDVGKTIVTAALNRALWSWHTANFKAFLAIKPIQTGVSSTQNATTGILDSSIYTHALGHIKVPDIYKPKTIHSFTLPASPHLAAKDENKSLCVNNLCSEITSLQSENVPMLLEGAGGVCVPLNQGETSLDLMQSLAMPVLLVMHNTLGALNHVLLSLEALKMRGLKVIAIVSTEKEKHNSIIKQDNIAFLKEYAPHIPIYSLPYLKDLASNCEQVWSMAANALAPLAKELVSFWKKSYEIALRQEITSQSDLINWDKAHLWHPYTSAITPLPVYEVSHTKGMHIYLQDRHEPLVDGMSSWWCAVHGYGHEELINAAQKQAKHMSHIMFGGLTHVPAVNAAKKLLHLFENCGLGELSRVFWADSGSVAVEVALKMALQYQQGRAETQRTKFLSPRGGYYGDTMGAMSVCDPINGMHRLFNDVLTQHIFIPRPSCAFDGNINNSFDSNCLTELEQAFNEYGNELCAVIIEPIVQGAGGMWFYDPRYLMHLQKLCKEHHVLLIFDEIATGFGRTGKMFAAEWAEICPDICCVGKALTGGMLSLGASICTEDVASGICAHEQVFMHGPTFMGNALACAVACASLDIFSRNHWQEQVLNIEKELKQNLEECAKLEGVADVRVLGAIGVVEMQNQVNVAALQEFFVKNNVWIRPFAKLIYIMPPYIATNFDIKCLSHVIIKAIKLGVHKV